jgi:hypothetical protein
MMDTVNISGSYADYGGAFYLSNSKLSISQSNNFTVFDVYANLEGGVFYADSSILTIYDTIISTYCKEEIIKGTLIYSNNTDVTINKCEIFTNSSPAFSSIYNNKTLNIRDTIMSSQDKYSLYIEGECNFDYSMFNGSSELDSAIFYLNTNLSTENKINGCTFMNSYRGLELNLNNLSNFVLSNSTVANNIEQGILINANNINTNTTVSSTKVQEELDQLAVPLKEPMVPQIVNDVNENLLVSLTNCTIANGSYGIVVNGSGTTEKIIHIVNTVLAYCQVQNIMDNSNIVQSNGNNCCSDNSGLNIFDQSTDMNNIEPMLKSLDNNGGILYLMLAITCTLYHLMIIEVKDTIE